MASSMALEVSFFHHLRLIEKGIHMIVYIPNIHTANAHSVVPICMRN